jgi:peptide/nickel transport system ATP-binding protein
MLANPQQDYTKSLWAVRDFRRAPPAARHLDEGPLLEIRDMTAGYGAVDILKGINLTITRGTTVAVVSNI